MVKHGKSRRTLGLRKCGMAWAMALAMLFTSLPQNALTVYAAEAAAAGQGAEEAVAGQDAGETVTGQEAAAQEPGEKTGGSADGTDIPKGVFDVCFVNSYGYTVKAAAQTSPGEDYVFTVTPDEGQMVTVIEAYVNYKKDPLPLTVSPVEGAEGTYCITEESLAEAAQKKANRQIWVNIGVASNTAQQSLNVNMAGCQNFSYRVGENGQWSEPASWAYPEGQAGENVYFKFDVQEGYELDNVTYFCRRDPCQPEEETVLSHDEKGIYTCTLGELHGNRIQISAYKQVSVSFNVEHAKVYHYDNDTQTVGEEITGSVTVLAGRDFYYAVQPEEGYKVSSVDCMKGATNWKSHEGYGYLAIQDAQVDQAVVYVTTEPVKDYTITFDYPEDGSVSLTPCLDGEMVELTEATLKVDNTQVFEFDIRTKKPDTAYYVTYQEGDKAEKVFNYLYMDITSEGNYEYTQIHTWNGYVQNDMKITIREVPLATVTVVREGAVDSVNIWDEVYWENDPGEEGQDLRFRLPAGYGVRMSAYYDALGEYEDLVMTVTAKDGQGNVDTLEKQYDEDACESYYAMTIEGDTTVTVKGEVKNREFTVNYPAGQGQVQVFDNKGEEITLSDRGTFEYTGSRSLVFKIKPNDANMRPRLTYGDPVDGRRSVTLKGSCLEDGWYCSNLYEDEDGTLDINTDNCYDSSIDIDFVEYHTVTVNKPEEFGNQFRLYRLTSSFEEEGVTYFEFYDELTWEDDIKSVYTVEGPKDSEAALGFIYPYKYKVDITCTANGRKYAPEVKSAYLDGGTRINYCTFDFTEDVVFDFDPTEKQRFNVTVSNTDNVSLDWVEGESEVDYFDPEFSAFESKGNGTYSVLEGSKIYISLTPKTAGQIGKITITANGKTEELPYKTNSPSLKVNSDMDIRLDAAEAESHKLSMDNPENLVRWQLLIDNEGIYEEVAADADGKYTVKDDRGYRLNFNPKTGKQVTKVEVQYGSKTDKEEKTIHYNVDEDVYTCYLGYGQDDMTIYLTYEDGYTLSFDAANASIYQRGNWDFPIEESKFTLGKDESFEFVVNDGDDSCGVTVDSDCFTLVKKQHYSASEEDGSSRYYYYVLSPIAGKELPAEVKVKVTGVVWEEHTLTVNFDGNLCNVQLYQKGADGSLSRYSKELVSQSPVQVTNTGVLFLGVFPLGKRTATVTWQGADGAAKTNMEQAFVTGEDSYGYYYYIGNVSENATIDVSVASGAEKEYNSVAFGVPGFKYASCFDVYETKYDIRLNKWNEGYTYYQVEAGKKLSFYYLTAQGYEIDSVETDDDTQPTLTAVHDEETDRDVYSITPTQDMVITPKLVEGTDEVVKYTVTFDMQGHGEPMKSLTVKEGGKITVPAEPEAEGYIFGGWFKDAECKQAWNFEIDTVGLNTVLYAKWTEIPNAAKYTVTFNLQGHGDAINDISVPKGEKVSAPTAPTAEGFTFGGWYKDAECKQAWDFESDTVGANTTLYAKWTETPDVVKYTVTFDLQGHGNAIGDIIVSEGEKISAPAAPTAEGFTFGGWYKDAECKQVWNFDIDTVGANTVLYAKWTEAVVVPTTYVVTYDMQGHGIAPEGTTVNAGAKLAEPTAPSEFGFVFRGWYKEAACINAWNFDTDVVTADTVLYAKWEDDPDTESPADVEDTFYETEERIDLNTIEGAIANVKAKTYDGNPYMPTVKVTARVNGKKTTLTEGTDYRVLYKNNINAGTGTVIVKGNGIYKGEITKTFTINEKSVKKLKVLVGGMGLNDKSAPPVYVYDGSKLLQSGIDYTLEYPADMTAAKGTKSVTVKAADNSNYTGSRVVKVKVYDAENILGFEDVKLEYDSTGYTGKALKPTVTVEYKGNLVDKKKYSVKYMNNREAGTAYVIVTGKKEYGGSVVKSFTITPVENNTFALKKAVSDKITYNGKLQKPKVTVVVQVNGKNKTLKAGRDYTISYSNNLHATTDARKAVITIKGKGNYANVPTKTFTFDIKPQNIKKVSVKGTKDKLSLTYAKRALKQGTDYTVSYGAEAKGKVEVTITGRGDFTGTVTKKVKIAAK